MVSFEFYNPVKVIFGVGEVSKVGTEAASLGKKAMLLCYEDHSYLSELLGSIKKDLEKNNVSVTEFYKIQANPLIGHVRQAVDLCIKNDIELIIGVGGGSVMDSAKIIAAGALYEGDVWGMILSRHDYITAVPPKAALPTIMLPTLPATSSEMNCGAVVTNEETKEKSYVFNPVIFPRVSIVDPALTCSLPAYQTACGGVDAISHMMESYFNCVPDTDLQDRLQEGAIATIMNLLPKVIKEPKNVELRAQIQWASTLAWNGWLQAGINPGSPMHQIGHVLSARFNVTHGASLGIIMPAFFKHVYKKRADRFALFAQKVLGIDTKGMTEEEAALKAIETFEGFIASVGVQTKLSQYGISPDSFEAIADDVVRISCDKNGNLPSNPPVGREGIIEVLKLAL